MKNDLISCKSCKKQVSVSQLKADKTGRGFVCLDCYNKQHSKVEKPSKVEEMYEGIETREIKRPNYTKRGYRCYACNYKFESFSFKEGKMCPYCGRSNTVVKVIPTSQIIKEASSYQFAE